MYGYTPPTVVAVDPDLLSSCGGFQAVAAAIEAEVKRRPAWIVVGVPQAVKEASAGQRAMLLESYCLDPRDAPEGLEPIDAVAAVLAAHLRHIGYQVPVLPAPDAPKHVEASRIVPGNWKDAAHMAKAAGATQVYAWTADPEWVVDSVMGIPFLPVLNQWGLASPQNDP